MKKIYYLSIYIFLVFSIVGCSNKEKWNCFKEANNVKMYYGTKTRDVNYITDEDTIEEFMDCFNNLTFEATDKKIDTSTMINMVFYNDEIQIATIRVDNEGLFQINEDTTYLQVASGSFNYDDFFYYVLII